MENRPQRSHVIAGREDELTTGFEASWKISELVEGLNHQVGESHWVRKSWYEILNTKTGVKRISRTKDKRISQP